MSSNQQQVQQPPVAAHEAPSAAVQSEQPKPLQGMDSHAPQPSSTEPELGLRGGNNGRGGCCPGRFCFIIPCPLPFDCCIIPCPC